jgi:hypothetical protein
MVCGALPQARFRSSAAAALRTAPLGVREVIDERLDRGLGLLAGEVADVADGLRPAAGVAALAGLEFAHAASRSSVAPLMRRSAMASRCAAAMRRGRSRQTPRFARSR